MQLIHRLVQIARSDLGNDLKCTRNRRVNRSTVVKARYIQHVIHHIVADARMAYPEPQPCEVGAYKRCDIAQTVVAAVTTAAFQACDPRRQIEFVVDHQNIAHRNSKIIGIGRNAGAAGVHKRGWLEYRQRGVLNGYNREFGLIPPFWFEACAAFGDERIDEPKPRVMARAQVLRPGVAKSDDQLHDETRSGWALCLALNA